MPLGGLECPFQIVEHRQELPNEPLVGVRYQTLLVTRRPLAVILELGRDALEVSQVLIALGSDLDDGVNFRGQTRGVGPLGCCRVRPLGGSWGQTPRV